MFTEAAESADDDEESDGGLPSMASEIGSIGAGRGLTGGGWSFTLWRRRSDMLATLFGVCCVGFWGVLWNLYLNASLRSQKPIHALVPVSVRSER